MNNGPEEKFGEEGLGKSAASGGIASGGIASDGVASDGVASDGVVEDGREVAMSGDEFENEAGEALPVSEAAMEAMLRAEFREPRELLALPAGFKERVLARAAAESRAGAGPVAAVADPPKVRGKVIAFPRGPVWRMVAGGALAASLIGGTFGVELERRQHEAARMAYQRQVANQQFEQATRITEAALAHTREQLQRAGVFEDAGR